MAPRPPSDTDRLVANAAEALSRIRADRIVKQGRSIARRVKRAVTYAMVSLGAILFGAIVWGMVSPIGLGGVLLVMLTMIVAVVLSVALSGERKVPAQSLPRVELKALPAATSRWLEGQRRALPAPAVSIADSIDRRLESLAPQLARLDPSEPAAAGVRALLSEHLPELVAGWQTIPADLRRKTRNGRTPDAELVEGLGLIDQELGEMSEMIARGDLDRLATHNRYLALKYADDGKD